MSTVEITPIADADEAARRARTAQRTAQFLGAAARLIYVTSVIDVHRHAPVLTYRESKSSVERRARIMELEVETSEPLRVVLRAGRDAGVFEVKDVDLVSFNLLVSAVGSTPTTKVARPISSKLETSVRLRPMRSR